MKAHVQSQPLSSVRLHRVVLFAVALFTVVAFQDTGLTQVSGEETKVVERENAASLALKALEAHIDVQDGHIVSVWFDGSRELTDKDLVHLESLTELKSLSISKMIDPALQHLVKNKAASGEGITDDGIKSIRGLRNLETLALFNLTGIRGDGLGHLHELHKLRRVYLKGTPPCVPI